MGLGVGLGLGAGLGLGVGMTVGIAVGVWSYSQTMSMRSFHGFTLVFLKNTRTKISLKH